jgi:hypothetical protein
MGENTGEVNAINSAHDQYLNELPNAYARALAAGGTTPPPSGDGLFGQLAKVLGGHAPTLNFVPSVDPGGDELANALLGKNQINLSSGAMTGLVDPRSQYHNQAVNVLAHEMMHLRQTPAVLGDTTQREGGAQAFSDLVTPDAAKAAHIPYSGVPGAYDSNYGPLVQLIQQKYGPDWILGGQMGKPPVAWP